MASGSFYFYDLETSGINPRSARIMQFAGQRTDMNLNPIGEPHNLLIKMTDDVLPEPDAILITGITPQQTVSEGITEEAFLQVFFEEVATPGTIFVGFNTIRFDDEFMRYLMWRNYHDPYEWQWKNNRSRWDLLDVVRMTRALRPDGIKWPFAPDGKPTNRLELLTALNGLEHSHAHDALSDVYATIAVARLISETHPKLFSYLLGMRDKRQVAALVEQNKPFVYSSGKYANEWEKTTVAVRLGDNPKKQGALVYDLRHDPTEFLKLSPSDLAKRWQWTKDEEAPKRLPIKTLQYNRCPAIAPLTVLDESSKRRLNIHDDKIAKHLQLIQKDKKFLDNVYATLEQMNKQQQTSFLSDQRDVDSQLYDGFVPDADRRHYSSIHATVPDEKPAFQDERLNALWPLYKARNFPSKLSDEERTIWEEFRVGKLMTGGQQSTAAKFFARLSQLAQRTDLSSDDGYILEELQLWGQSILPSEY
ncbi:exodeoxyribonuclease I [Patescibacteria group bacterium]|nr:MAG: exodeoxyribonuclease I [Patescibacteria group bacterium]